MRVTVKAKLLASSFIFIILIVGIAVFSISGLQSMGNGSKEIAQKWTPRTSILGTIDYYFSQIRIMILKDSLEEDNSKFNAWEKQIQEYIAQLKASSEQLEPLIDNDKDRKLYDDLKNKWKSYEEYIPVLLKAARSFNDKEMYIHLSEEDSKYQALAKIQSELILSSRQNAQEITDEAVSTFESSRLTIIIISIIAIVVALGIAYFLPIIIVGPIRRVTEQVQKVAEGDLTVEKIHIKNNDEIGDLAKGFNKMVTDLHSIVNQVNDATLQVAASSEQLTASAEQSSLVTEQIATATQQIASGADDQLKSIHDTTQWIKQLAADAKGISENSQDMIRLAAEASDTSGNGMDVVRQVIRQMEGIHQSVQDTSDIINVLGGRSQEIGSIVNVIGGIASQTNLLALNAAIEAARAGEQGRGFAVVANEVRKLAEQATQSAQQITQMIGLIQTEVEQAVISMQQGSKRVAKGLSETTEANQAFLSIQDAIAGLTGKVGEVAQSVERLDEGSVEIVKLTDEVMRTAEETASGSQQNAAATQEQLASMEEIASSAEALSSLAEKMSLTLTKFKV